MFIHPLGLAAVILLPLLHIVGCEISSDLYLTWKIAVHTRGSASNNCHYFGFFTEFLGLSSALIKAMPNTRLVYANCSEVFYASMFKEEATSMRALSIPRDASTREVFVYHGTTCDIFPKDRSKDSSIRIGRYMFEKDDYLQVKKRSPQKRDLDRIFGCSRRMDEIWIPSEFQRPIFARHVPNSKIFVVPEAVDTSLFDPSLAQLSRNQTKSLNDSSFIFISIFSWSYRKGYDVLLGAFFRAFEKSDRVSLKIVSSVPDFVGGTKNISNRIEEFKRSFCIANELFCKDRELPEVLWEGVGKSFSRFEIRDLLSTSHAFALASRGEGWGLPVAEAMSMSLPVVVPNHTGLSAFCNEDIAYIVPVEEIRKDRAGFPQIPVNLFTRALQKVVEDTRTTGRAQEVGRKARQSMKERWSPEKVVSLISARLGALSRVKWK